MPVTSTDGVKMSMKREVNQPHPFQRPALVSNHSNSVPSTPQQYPRDFNTHSRSPSPNGALGNHSPRSVSSEANGSMATLRKSRSGCPFETSIAFGRRRIPYNIGTDMLPKVKDVKASLNPKEEDKLSGDMRELYDRILPSDESEARRRKLVQKVESILRTEWPGNEFKVHVFGSSGNMLCTSESDVDMCIQTSMKKLESMHILAEVLNKNGMERVVCVASAKVPIVKIWDPELGLACDMNVNNMLALQNTRLIKTYVQIDERVRPLAMIVKHWTKQRILNDAALGGTLSSYTWICMILNFLQIRKPPIIPSLHHHEARNGTSGNAEPPAFADNIDALRTYGQQNKESLGQLLFQFFRFYGHEIDYMASVISIREGRILSRKEKGWDVESHSKEGHNRLCVEEPFNTIRNLGNSADDTAFRGIHEEIRRAFDLLADGGQLDKMCEQFEFPPEEKTVFKRPTPAPKPVLSYASATAPRPPRGSGSNRGGRGPTSLKQNQNYGRRASSGANYGHLRPFVQSPGAAAPGQDYFPQDIQSQLFYRYQQLESQKAQLQGAYGAQVHAHYQAQAQAQAHAQVVAAQSRANTVNGSPQRSGYATTGRSSPRTSDATPLPIPFYAQYLYHYPTYEQGLALSQISSQDGSTRTNPSSPSLAQSTPSLRRAIHRTSAASEIPSATVRSQSQPARGLPPQQLVQAFQMPQMPQLPPEYAAQHGYHPAQVFAQAPVSQPASAEPVQQPFPAPLYSVPALLPEQGLPKEYLGYYVQNPPKVAQDFSLAPIPSWSDIEARRRQRRISPEMPQGFHLNSGARKLSRSPSPLGTHLRSYSTGQALRSAPLNGSMPKGDRVDSTRPSFAENGLLIVNGSYDRASRPAEPYVAEEGSESANTESSGGFIPTPAESHDSDSQFNLELPAMRQEQLAANVHLEQQAMPEILNHLADSHQDSTAGKVVPVHRPNGLTIVSSTPGYSFASAPEPSPYASSRKCEQPLSPKSDEQSKPRLPKLPNGIAAINTAKAKADLSAELKSATGPFLSPVFETRTPSPTHRNLEAKQLQPQTNGQASQVKHKALTTIKPQLPVAAKATPDTAAASTNGQPSGWQKTSGKKKNHKKGKSGANKNNAESIKSQGEQTPAHAVERKGG